MSFFASNEVFFSCSNLTIDDRPPIFKSACLNWVCLERGYAVELKTCSLLRIRQWTLQVSEGSWLVFGANGGLFPHLSRVRLWMLRVTMLMQIVCWMRLSDGENHLPIGSLVEKTYLRHWKASRSGLVGRSSRSSCENYHIQRELARPSASLVIS